MRTKLMLSLCVVVCLFLSLTNTSSSNNRKVSVVPINPRAEANVRITFDGLMALCMGNPKRVSVGILNVHNHLAELRVSKVNGSQKSMVAMIKGEELTTLYIDVEGNEPEVKQYVTSSSIDSDENDFRWNLDFESDLYQQELQIREDKLFGKIHISAGLFYAADVSKERVRFYTADGSGKSLAFNRRIAIPAGIINLTSDRALVIRGKQTILRLVVEPGVHYEIALSNEPAPEMASIDHFNFYYDFLATKVTPYNMAVVQKAALQPRPLMCLTTVFSRSKLN
ncbi:MAG: hypothetical protein AB1489_41840 [Acidobacteriota bacterium]